MSAATYSGKEKQSDKSKASSRGISVNAREVNSSSDSEDDSSPRPTLRNIPRDSRDIEASIKPIIPPRPDADPYVQVMDASGEYLDLDAPSLSNTVTSLDHTSRSAFQPTATSRATVDLDETMDRRYEDPDFMNSLPRGTNPPLIAESVDTPVQMSAFGNRRIYNPNAGDSNRHVNLGNIGANRAATGYVNNSLVDTIDVRLQAKEAADHKDDEKKRMMCHKYSLFVMCIIVLVGALIAAVVVFRKKDDSPDKGLGSEIPEPITWDECPPVTLGVGEKFNFTCRFNVFHEYRKQLRNTSVYVVLMDSRGHDVSDIVFTFDPAGSENVLSVLNNPSVTCSHAGSFSVVFYQDTDRAKVLHTATVTISIKASAIESEMVQELVDPDVVSKLDCTTSDVTKFLFKCRIRNDCDNYDVDFYGNKGGRQYSFKHLMSVTSDYSNEAGYDVTGNVAFSESDVTNYSALGCKFTSTRKVHRSLLSLPGCDFHSNCTTPTSRWYFNCTKNSTHLRNIEEGNCDFNELTRCFTYYGVPRPAFPYLKVPFFDRTHECDNNGTNVCILGWCRRGNRIVRSESPVVKLCGEER